MADDTSDDEEPILDWHELSLDDQLVRGLMRLGWHEPTSSQEKAIPLALNGIDILVRAKKTGSERISLFAIPLIQQILNNNTLERNGTHAIVVSPSREFCHQIKNQFDSLSYFCHPEIKCIDAASDDIDILPDLVVGTPADLLARIQAGSLLNLKKTVKSFVLDGAELLLRDKFKDDMQKLFDKVLPIRGCQTYVTSATEWPSSIDLKNLLHRAEIADLNKTAKTSKSTTFIDSQASPSQKTSYLKHVFLIALVIISLYAMMFQNRQTGDKDKTRENEINLEQVNSLNLNYPGLLSAKQLRLIKARIAVMDSEVSILMLLGKTRDSHCKLDPTFCVGQTIANVTQSQFGYIDASDPYLNSNELKNELGKALDNYKNPVIIDSLEQLPGTEVMNLFQFIDKDESHRRRGMLILIVYTGHHKAEARASTERLKEADIAEKVLLDRWSYFIPKDSLTSVLSRMCGSIVKVY